MKKYLKAIIACVFCTLVLSSCNASSPSNSNIVTESESLIKEITSSYLTEISTGTFATEIYKSNFTPNISFKDISFKQPQAQDLMNESMTRMTFKIQSVEKAENFFSDLFDKRIKANCFVEISAIDIEGMRAKINDPSLGYLELINLTKANDESLFIKKTIAIKLAYDDTLMKWEIMDNSQLMGLIMDPYRKMSLENPAGKPDTFAAEYIQNLLALDTQKLFDMSIPSNNINSQIMGNIIDARFFKDNNIDLEIAKIIFQYVEIEAQPSYKLEPGLGTPPYDCLEESAVPLLISFPDITDGLRSLGHPASQEEIFELLEKNQALGKLTITRESLYLALETNTHIWRTTDNDLFCSVVKKLWNSIYVYPQMPGPEEIADTAMKELTLGRIDSVFEFREDDPNIIEALKYTRISFSDAKKNNIFIQTLLEGYDYKVVSVVKSQDQPHMYLATYSVALPDLNLLQKQIKADKETLVPLLKSGVEIRLSNDNAIRNQPALFDLYLSYVEYVRDTMASSTLPVQEYQFEMQFHQDFDSRGENWFIDDFYITKPSLEGSFLDYSNSDIADAVVKSILADGIYGKEDFEDSYFYIF